jgi:hypothetical protein
MVVNDFYIDGAGFVVWPFKTDPVLVIDADAELTFTIALEPFQSIPRDSAKILEACCRFKGAKPPLRLPRNGCKCANELSPGELFSLLVPVFWRQCVSQPM